MSEENDIDYAIGCAYNYLAEFGEDTKENLARLDRAGEMANIIEKQQKEIGRLKQNTMLLAKELDERDEEIKNLEEEIELGNALSISKDKIRDKIKELEKYFDGSKENIPTSANQFIIDSVAINVSISLLKELLEEK